MATLSWGSPPPEEDPTHQHPALLGVRYAIASNQFRLDKFPSFVEKAVPQSWHVEPTQTALWVFVDFYYAALGAWPADAWKYASKIGLPLEAFARPQVRPGRIPETHPLFHWHREPLCGHPVNRVSNGDCDVPVSRCHELTAEAMRRVREENWRTLGPIEEH